MKQNHNQHPKHGHARHPVRHFDQPSRQPLSPSDPKKGLSSELNRKWMNEILLHSLPQDVTAALIEAGYSTLAGNLRTPAESPEVQRAVTRFLQSDAGKRLIEQKTREQAVLAAQQELRSPVGQRTLCEIKTRLFGTEIEHDKDLFARLCHEAVKSRVRQWLESPEAAERIALETGIAAKRKARDGSPVPGLLSQKPMLAANPDLKPE
jgi:hypothetical protein